MFINKRDIFETIAIFPHLNEAPTQATCFASRIEIFDKGKYPDDPTRKIRFQDNWYTADEMMELSMACQKAAEIVGEGVRGDV